MTKPMINALREILSKISFDTKGKSEAGPV